jgi:hypothetical protein
MNLIILEDIKSYFRSQSKLRKNKRHTNWTKTTQSDKEEPQPMKNFKEIYSAQAHWINHIILSIDLLLQKSQEKAQYSTR